MDGTTKQENCKHCGHEVERTRKGLRHVSGYVHCFIPFAAKMTKAEV